MRRACKLDIWSKVKNSAPSMAIGGPTDACLNMDSNRDGWTTTSISVPQMIKVWTKMTRLQLMMQVLSHDLTKNLTGHWFTYGIPKHQKWIVRPIAFRVYEMLWSKIDHLAKKAVLWIRIWITWLWKALDVKPLTPGQALGCGLCGRFQKIN